RAGLAPAGFDAGAGGARRDLLRLVAATMLEEHGRLRASGLLREALQRRHLEHRGSGLQPHVADRLRERGVLSRPSYGADRVRLGKHQLRRASALDTRALILP